MAYDTIGRRKAIKLIGATAMAPVVSPFVARAQQPGVRRIGVLMNLAENDPQGQARLTAFEQELRKLGWTKDQNVRIEYRWGAGDADRTRRYAAELVALAPNVILTSGTVGIVQLKQVTRTVPLVFVQVTDPVGMGLVESLARPGGNVTGFSQLEYGTSVKWLELLKEIAPRVTRVAVLRDTSIPGGIGQFGAIQAVAPSVGVELRPVDVRNAGEIESAIAAFARGSNDGLIVLAGALAIIQRELIIRLASRHQLPAVYPYRLYVSGGGLISYGIDPVEPFRRAASYVDRILKGAKPADLPVQAPTKYEMGINLKTAKALGLTVPPTLIARADEVIE